VPISQWVKIRLSVLEPILVPSVSELLLAWVLRTPSNPPAAATLLKI
jgi:hypothetical protein